MNFQEARANKSYQDILNDVAKQFDFEEDETEQLKDISLFHAVRKFDNTRDFGRFLFVTANNLFRKENLKRKKYNSIVVLGELPQRSYHTLGLLDYLEDPEERQIIYYKYWYNCTNAEICEMLEMTRTALKRKLETILIKMKQYAS